MKMFQSTSNSRKIIILINLPKKLGSSPKIIKNIS